MHNIYLVGFMGCGKSAVGRALARRLRRPFVDSDALVERRARKSVARLFEEKGEEAFRRLERRALERISRRRGAVAALGGGALLDPRNRALLEAGIVVRLTCAQPELWRRLKPELSRRPLLAGGRAGLKTLIARRKNGYARAALTVSTTRRGPSAAAALIARRLGGAR